MNLYRIIQEVVHNTIKHAHATKLTLELKADKDIVVLSMADNGIGFDKDNESANNGFGLKSLLRRTGIMNGKMFIDSIPGKGTSYGFEIPLQ